MVDSELKVGPTNKLILDHFSYLELGYNVQLSQGAFHHVGTLSRLRRSYRMGDSATKQKTHVYKLVEGPGLDVS